MVCSSAGAPRSREPSHLTALTQPPRLRALALQPASRHPPTLRAISSTPPTRPSQPNHSRSVLVVYSSAGAPRSRDPSHLTAPTQPPRLRARALQPASRHPPTLRAISSTPPTRFSQPNQRESVLVTSSSADRRAPRAALLASRGGRRASHDPEPAVPVGRPATFQLDARERCDQPKGSRGRSTLRGGRAGDAAAPTHLIALQARRTTASSPSWNGGPRGRTMDGPCTDRSPATRRTR